MLGKRAPLPQIPPMPGFLAPTQAAPYPVN